MATRVHGMKYNFYDIKIIILYLARNVYNWNDQLFAFYVLGTWQLRSESRPGVLLSSVSYLVYHSARQHVALSLIHI